AEVGELPPEPAARLEVGEEQHEAALAERVLRGGEEALVAGVLEPRLQAVERLQEAAELAAAAARGEHRAHGLVEGDEAGLVALLERDVEEDEGGVDGVVQQREAVERRAHGAAHVEGGV